jgi:hypothetical protein
VLPGLLRLVYSRWRMQPETEQAAVFSDTVPSDTVTIAGIALIAYILASVLHEGLGHGGACLATGGKPIMVSTVAMECSADNRLVIAGGTLVNVAAGALFLALGRMTRRSSSRLKFFLWLSMTVNLFTAAGYFLFSGIGGFGDWAVFIRGFSPQWAWRAGMTVFGAAAYLLVGRLALLELRPLIGSDRKERFIRAVRLTRVPYFAGGILACVAGALNPDGLILVALSAAASTFGGTSGLLWTIDWLNGDRIPLGMEPEPMRVRRSWGWIAAAGVLALAFIAVLGPGLRFTPKP